jgi:hypothetical protein
LTFWGSVSFKSDITALRQASEWKYQLVAENSGQARVQKNALLNCSDRTYIP